MTILSAKMQVFISYKRGDTNALSFQAQAIHDLLKDEYNVWMDTEDINPGDKWEEEIYNAIPRSDVMLVPLAPKTIESRWVPRELELAGRAQVCIIPLLVQGSKAELNPVLEHFKLTHLDYLEFFTMNAGEKAALKQAIEAKRGQTRENQLLWLTDFIRKGLQQSAQKPVAVSDKSRKPYTLSFHPCEIHLASGDMTDMQGIDVIINPENNYLQMARIFEATSISSKLRLLGSKQIGGEPITDTVQDDLNELRKLGSIGITVAPGEVVVTRAGHPESKLSSKMGSRYLFHVISVRVQHNEVKEEQVRPINDATIRKAVKNCLNAIIDIDAVSGVVAPSGSEQNIQQQAHAATYQPIESIIFPMFATGQGTRQSQDDIKQVARTVTSAIYEYLKTNPNAKKLHLKRIHICGYSEADVQIIQDEMDAILK
jgi:O-acetyl-ADP-ribose deacetylase (regulator of RNase III)